MKIYLNIGITDWFLCSCDSGETVNNRFASNSAHLSQLPSVSMPVFSIFPFVFLLDFSNFSGYIKNQ